MRFDNLYFLISHSFEQRFQFSFLLLLERFSFHSVNIVAIQHFKACRSVFLNICFCYKLSKNWSKVTNLGYDFDAKNLHHYTKNRDLMLDNFCRAHQNLSWVFVQPSLLNECSDFYIFIYCWESLVFIEIILLIVLALTVNSMWVNCTHFLYKTHFFTLEMIFSRKGRRIYLYIKLDN